MIHEAKQFDKQVIQDARIERTRKRKVEQGYLPSPDDWSSRSFSHDFYSNQKLAEKRSADEELDRKKLRGLFASKTNERVTVSEVSNIAGKRFDSIIGALTDPSYTPPNSHEDKTMAAVLGIPLGGMKEKPTLAQRAVIEFVRELGGASTLAGIPKKDWIKSIRPELENVATERVLARQTNNSPQKK